MIELADTSAWGIRHRLSPETRQTFEQRVEDGEIATCDLVKSELLYTARNVGEFRELREELDALPWCGIGPDEWRRSLDVYELLAAQGGAHHRRVKFGDLLVAAAAEAAGVGLLHYDRDFDRIEALTGQAVTAVAPIGSL